VLLSGKPDFPFCLCWANEPWSRRWNGQPEAVLRGQEYSPEDDLAHIRWLLPALADHRAIRIEGKPVFIVYQAQDLPNPAQTVEIWRREAVSAGLPGIYLISVETGRDAEWNATQVGFDAKLLFQPQFTSLFNSGADILIPGKEKLRVYDYERASKVLSNPPAVSYRRYASVFPNWDNAPRRGEEAVVLHNSTPEAYEAWLGHAIQRALHEPLDHRVVFLNAWNEWGEGCHLEPDVRSGRAYLEATRRALAKAGSPHATNGHLDDSSVVGTAPECGPRLESETGSSISAPKPSAPVQVASVTDGTYLSLLATARGERSADYVPLTEGDLTTETLPIKAIAFYLPQFHPIPENDEWWGKGFTEWANVSKAMPEFVGHYQPHLPGELGFYDLRVPEVQRRQVQLARKYGVHGFCFYYYWFAGKHLLERPLNQFISDPEIDFPFCICWANENWTRGWDGKESEILVAQHHSEEADLAFIRDLEPKLRHKNYIRIQGRPLLIVYRARVLPDPAATTRRWRDYCRQMGLGNPYLVAAQVFEDLDPREFGFDAAVQFPPNTPGLRTDLRSQFQPLNPGFTGLIHSYADLIRLTLERPQPPYQQFRTVCPGWDNDARRPGRGTTYALSSPKEYGRWLKGACCQALEETDPDKRLVFINAWNEWGEGAHLEPDRHYGYAYLQATADVLATLPKRISPSTRDWTILFVSHDAHQGGAQLVLLNQIAWFRQYTGINLRVLCLESGAWLSRFQELARTAVLSEITPSSNGVSDEGDILWLREFCGGAPDLIYANSVASGRAFAILRQFGSPILTHFHELESSIQRYAGTWIKDVLDHSNHYLACSEAVRKNLLTTHNVSPQALSTVYESIRPNPALEPLSGPERSAARARLGLAPNKQLVFGCGLGMPFRKGADLFIKVALELHRQGREDCHFYWIGELYADENDPQYGAWVDYLNQLPSPDHCQITFLGFKENPGEYIQTADVFLLPSREDPFPLVALEAAECSVPIICFADAGGVPDLVQEDAGFVVPFGEVRTMADRVITLLDDEALRRRFGAQARARVLSNFTTDCTAPHVLSVCRKTTGRKPAVSIIMPGYNHGQYLQERLASIFQQTYRDVEVILLDDASTDNSLEILQRYRHRADVRIVRNEQNSGSTFKQWLKGIALAQADLIWIAESDDRCEPDFLEALLPSFQNPEVKLAYTNSHIMDERGNVTGDYTTCEYLTTLSNVKWTKNYCVTAEEEINDGLGVKNTILSASAVVFRRFELTPEKCAILETMRLAGDWFLFTHAMAGGNVFYTARKLNYHRRHSESVIGKLIRQNKVNELFGEFYCVQNEIFSRYQLRNCFHDKWERYLRDQWHAFYPERPFDDLKSCYPFDRARAQIVSAVSEVRKP
jgi:lipopolysaccharide biosynthesis protein/glycosyltransferase involved in cell wall biosynthesis